MAQENIDVTVELTDALSRPARRAEEAIEDLDDRVDELDRSLKASTASTERQNKALAANARAAGKAAKEQERLGDSTEDTSKKTDRLGLLQRLLGVEVGKTSKKFKALGMVFKLLKLQAVVLAVSLLATGVAALGAAGFAAVAGLSPLVGLLGGLPSLVAAAVQGFAAVKVGMMGIGEATKAILEGDPLKVAEAMRKLTPEGQRLAETMAALVDGPLARMKQATQAAIAPGFTEALESLRPLLPVIQRGLVRTADTIGDLAARAARATDTPLFRAELGRVMAANNAALSLGGRAAGQFALAGLSLADAFRPVQREISRSVLGVAEFINQSVRAGTESGRLTAFFQRAWELAKDVGSVLADLAVALFNTGKQAGALGKALGSSLSDAAADWRAWTETVEGQNAIREWFRDARPVVDATLSLLRELGEMFGGLSNGSELAPLLSQIESQLLPAIQDLTSAVSDDLGPALVDAATAFVEFLTFLSASPVADILSALAAVTLAVAEGLNALPGPVKVAAAALIAFALAAQTVQAATARLAATSAGAFFASVAAGAREGSRGIGFFNRAAGGVMGATGAAARGVSGLAGAFGGPLGIALIGSTILLGKWMQDTAKAKQDAKDFANTLDDVTGKITRQTRELVKQKLVDDGALEDAERLGLSLGEVTQAAMGNADALESVRMQLDTFDAYSESPLGGVFDVPYLIGNSTELDSARKDLLEFLDDTTNAAKDGRTQWALASDAARELKIAAAGRIYSNMTNEQRAAAAAADVLTGSQRAQITAQRAAEDAARRSAGELGGQADETQRVIDATLELNALLDQRSTFVGYKQQILTTRETLKGVTDVLNENRTGLRLNTQDGIDTWNTFKDLATAAASIKNEGKQLAALEEVQTMIRRWGKAAGLSREDARRLSGEFITLKDTAEDVPERVDTEVTANTDRATRRLEEYQRVAAEIARSIANLFTFDFDPLAGATRIPESEYARRDGGPVWTGAPFMVGEAGPELFVGASGAASVIGAAGVEKRTFTEPGWVLPNSVYETVVAAPAVAPARVPAVAAAASVGAVAPAAPRESRDTDLAGWPDVHVHLHGDTGLTVADAEAAAVRAVRRLERERKERGY